MRPGENRALTPRDLELDVAALDLSVREGRFQRGLALISGLSSILGCAEVGYEHYRGSYSRRLMYTPVIFSAALVGAGLWAYRSRVAAKTILPAVSAVTLADCVVGFWFHIRGIHRKPGGWRLPVANIIMGPPLFAPLLLGVSAYLGLVASYMRRSGQPAEESMPRPAHPQHWGTVLTGGAHEPIGWQQDLREGRFQKHMASATVVAAFFGGFEALYSHYKNNFQYGVQWTPLVTAPLLMAAGVAAIRSPRAAHTLLPAASAIAIANGGVGFVYHARGVLRRPAGMKKLGYNILYGPPLFAPLLFAAAGFLGLLASLLRREKP